jgi:hypothetical protein
MLKLCIFLFAGFCVVGCGVRKPMAQFQQATIAQSTPEAFSLAVAFEVFNTNDEPLQLMMYDYVVKANGVVVYEGFASAEQSVPRESSVVNAIPIVFRRESIVGKEQVAWNLQGTLGFIPPKAISETLLDIGIWKPMTSIRAHGLVQVPEFDD